MITSAEAFYNELAEMNAGVISVVGYGAIGMENPGIITQTTIDAIFQWKYIVGDTKPLIIMSGASNMLPNVQAYTAVRVCRSLGVINVFLAGAVHSRLKDKEKSYFDGGLKWLIFGDENAKGYLALDDDGNDIISQAVIRANRPSALLAFRGGPVAQSELQAVMAAGKPAVVYHKGVDPCPKKREEFIAKQQAAGKTNAEIEAMIAASANAVTTPEGVHCNGVHFTTPNAQTAFRHWA